MQWLLVIDFLWLYSATMRLFNQWLLTTCSYFRLYSESSSDYWLLITWGYTVCGQWLLVIDYPSNTVSDQYWLLNTCGCTVNVSDYWLLITSDYAVSGQLLLVIDCLWLYTDYWLLIICGTTMSHQWLPVIDYLWLYSAVLGLRGGLTDFSRSQIRRSSVSLSSAHWAVSRASASWSQQSSIVSFRECTVCT